MDPADDLPASTYEARPPQRRTWAAIALLLLGAAFSIRGWQFGNPLIQVDENFYLLVGDRMLHGALPYVDIWDRKPIGLFLIYAGIRLLGGVGIVQYQVVATLFAAGTAFLIARIAARIAPTGAAVAAAILYLLLIQLTGGMGGQSPVFYNLLMAGAALVTLRVAVQPRPPAGALQRAGSVAMLLVGVAMQIKYSVIFEGVFLGIVLLAVAWRSLRSVPALAALGAVWIGLALAPTLAALLYYVARGQTQAFVYANFLSIGGRGHEPASVLLGRLAATWEVLHLPVFGVTLSVILAPWRALPGGTRASGFVMAWLGAAILGYLLFGTYFDHYALPLMVPIAILCAPLFGYRPRRIGAIATGVMLIAATIASAAVVRANHVKLGGARTTNALVAAIRPHLTNCLYVFAGDSILYHLTGSCLPSRYAFPSHLYLTREAGAIGVDPVAEIRRIMAGRPSVIVDTGDADPEQNPVAVGIVRAALARDYRPVLSVPRGKAGHTLVYVRLPGR